MNNENIKGLDLHELLEACEKADKKAARLNRLESIAISATCFVGVLFIAAMLWASLPS